ncbi:uncharacterized protein [Cardiocondyla obscurior]|uniref:uncharacterized protein n=1 Tax=Cardiocondyla obscurior TaxID=286306 RepID=UPI00396568DF
MSNITGTAWIQELNKINLKLVCEVNNIKIKEADTLSSLREKLRAYIKQEISAGRGEQIKIPEAIKSEQQKKTHTVKETRQPTPNKVSTEQSSSLVTLSRKTMEFSANLDFDIDKDDWKRFIDRIEQYFIANDIIEAAKKRSILLSKVNAATHDVIDKICKPNKPREKTYEELIKIVKDYLKPPASYLIHRNTFRQRIQRSDETISQYVAALKELAKDCKFRDGDIDDQVLDQLRTGLKSKIIKAELLKIETIKLDIALKKALGSEAAEKGAEKLQQGNKSSQRYEEIYKLNNFQKKTRPVDRAARLSSGQRPINSASKTSRGSSSRGSAHCYQQRLSPSCGNDTSQYRNYQRRQPLYSQRSYSSCYRCGKSNHPTHKCRYVNAICYACNKKGHIRPACKSNLFNRTTRVGYINSQTRTSDTDSITEDLQELFRNGQADIYNMNTAYIPGKTRVEPQYMTVEINGVQINMEIDTGAAMSIISKDLKDKYFNTLKLYNADVEFINHDKTINKPMGSFNKGKIKLELKNGAQLKYVLTRSIPFALKDKVEKKLKRLVQENIIVPIKTNFKVTVNPQLKAICYAPPNFDHAIAKLQTQNIENKTRSKYYSKIDLKEAFLQVSVDES